MLFAALLLADFQSEQLAFPCVKVTRHEAEVGLEKLFSEKKLAYPPAADRILNRGVALGGDIMIHGNCVTIGCLPIEDEHVKELYWLAVVTKTHAAKIPVYIFPFRFTDAAKERAAMPSAEWEFWDNLREGYERFVRAPKPLAVSVGASGRYVFTK